MVLKGSKVSKSTDLLFSFLGDFGLSLNQFSVEIFGSVESLIEVILSDFLLSLIEDITMFHVIRKFTKVSKIIGIEGSMNNVFLLIMILEERWGELSLDFLVKSGT